VWCAALSALAFLQQPGLIVPDSKLDLAVDPIGFLSRASRMWEPQGFFGQLQNQAYGYAWPIGPFFGLGDLLGIDAWVVQRLWLTALLVSAFMGVVRLTGALRIGTPTARVLAGLAFAMSPRLVTTLGPISVEALPTCVAPWILLPLVRAGAGRLSPRRAAALSGLAFTFAGGVNAVAAIAALVVPGLYVLTRAGGLRSRLGGWWVVAIGLASVWWVVPLLLLGRFSPPFIDYIETAAATTAPTTLTDVLRGTSHWVGHLAIDGRPVWPAGWSLVHVPALIVDTAIVTALGLVGLTRRGMSERRWLVLSVVTGVALVSMGHVGDLTPPWAASQRVLLDGALAPFRNLHKFDVVLRLPLVLGLCALLATVPRWTWRWSPDLRVETRRLVGIVAVLGIVGGAAPVLSGNLHPPGSFAALPKYWEQTAHWLDRHAGEGRALLVPGSRFGDYVWGRPKDEPLQPLATTPWGVRDAVPLTPPGTIRLLDAVDRLLASGRGSPALAPVLARAGVAHLVVRNDLARHLTQSPRPVLVHAALARSPGLRRVASFGPVVGAPIIPGTFVDEGLDLPYPAVEVYEVRGGTDGVTLTPAASTVLASGGPESLVALLERGWADGRPVVFSGDADGVTLGKLREASAREVVTDGLRRREVTMGRQDGNASATLTLDDPLRLDSPARDYLPWESAALETTAVLVGARRVSASSSASDPSGLQRAFPARQPYSAADGDTSTAWRPRPDLRLTGQWWELDLGRTVPLRGARVLGERGTAKSPRTATVQVDGRRIGEVSITGGSWTSLPTAGMAGKVLRLNLRAEADDPTGMGIAEVAIPGVQVRRPLRTPAAPGMLGSAAVTLDVAVDGRSGCVDVGERVLCAAGLTRPGEEDAGLDRQVEVAAAGTYRVAATAVPRAGPALDALLGRAGRGARASSAEIAAPVAGAEAAFDGDLTTAWVSATGDPSPTLAVRWDTPRIVSGAHFLLDPAVAASRAREVEIRIGSKVYARTLDVTGRVSFPATRTDRLSIVALTTTAARSVDPETGAVELRPFGISELRLVTDAPLPRPVPDTELLELPCGAGPDLVVGGRTVHSAVSATRADLRRLNAVALRACGDATVELSAGSHRVSVASGNAFRGISLGLQPVGWSTEPGTALRAEVRRWDAEHRVVQVGERPVVSLLAVPENTNTGWKATLGGVTLRPVVVDGWRQGWWVPAGRSGEIVLDYAPGSLYRSGLAAGLLALLALGMLAFLRRGAPVRSYPRAGGAGVAVALAGALLVAATGLVGVAGVAAAVVLRATVPRGRAHVVLGAVAGGAFLLAGGMSAAAALGILQGAGSSGASVACVLALSCLVVAVPAERSATSPRSRIGGRSTTR
jgi:arabinofuranan 3-O-arabinosyltransferase